MRRDEKLQEVAAKGLRERMVELLEEFVDYKQTLPMLSPLASVQAALSATIDQIDGGPRRQRVAAPRQPNGATNGVSRGARSHKAKPRKKKGEVPKKLTDAAKAKSWEVGRELLVELSDHDGGLSVGDLAKKLKLSDAATYARLKVREKHGHVKLIDADKRIWAVVPDGRIALRNDRDSEL